MGGLFDPFNYGGRMIIPNDEGGLWRLRKFVEYQHLAPAVDPLTYAEFAQRNNFTIDDCVNYAWFHSLTYCELTAGFLWRRFNFKTLQPDEVIEFWQEYKYRLIFQSARKYVQNMDWFNILMFQYMEATQGKPYAWLEKVAGHGSPREKYKAIEKEMNKWKFMGRFSIDLFLEALITFKQVDLIPMKLENDGYDWAKTSNLTSGMFNIFYQDHLADLFDKGSFTMTQSDREYLDDRLARVLKAVEISYPEQTVDSVSVVNKICSFRNLFKKARYGGYHHDRQLQNLLWYAVNLPEAHGLWWEFFQIRDAIFPEHMLGELNGWKGIRKERKKLWVEKGLTGVESISEY